MNRKAIGKIAVLLIGMIAVPLAAEAQQAAKVYRIGVLTLGRFPFADEIWSPFRLKLWELGWIAGKNYVVEERHGEQGKLERLPELAAELVALNVDVIVTPGTPPTLAAKQATQRIPIVFPSAGDPVEKGLVASLARPGGNVTGIAHHLGFGKHLEVLKEAVPKVSRVAFVHNPAAFGSPEYLKASLATLETEARRLNLKVQPVPIHAPDELERVFAEFMRSGPEGAYVDDVPATITVRDRLCRLAIQYRLSVISRARLFPESGCLLSYGEHLADKFRQAAVLVDKILRGAKPADLPVEQPTKFELVLNLKTAKALGLAIPQSVLIRADEVIQ
jgi:putative ABC transport system substrate-binding protein